MHTMPEVRAHSREQLVGSTIGAWMLGEVLGEGATAVVYRAHPVPGSSGVAPQVVALKVLRSEAATDPRLRAAFQRESRILSKTHHPGIVSAYDFGVEDGRAYLALALIEGETLEEMLTPKRRLGEVVAIDVTTAIARALGALHRQRIVHRDVKPGNILIEAGNRHPMLFDLGAAIDLSIDTPTAGTVYGTPAYVSPEQARGDQEIDGRADIYALGVTLYRMLAGRKPFYGSRLEVLKAHVEDVPPAPSSFGFISPELEAILLKAMAKSPDARFQDADAFADALTDARENSTEARAGVGERLRDWIRGNSPPIT